MTGLAFVLSEARWNMLVTTLLLGVLGVSAASACLWIRTCRPREGEIVLFRCAACGQKLRCLASKAGRAGMCPRCRQRWTLPASSHAPSAAEEACDGYRVRVGARRMAPHWKARPAPRATIH